MQLFKAYYAAMLELGILTAPTPYEVNFVSAAHSDEDIERSISAYNQALIMINNKG
ncbi:Glutamate-1-semialdehyde 2,1-aminomutase [compost metagenome]